MPDSFETSWTVAHQAPLSMGFPRQEYWRGLPCPSPGDLPKPGIKPMAPTLAGRFFATEPLGKPAHYNDCVFSLKLTSFKNTLKFLFIFISMINSLPVGINLFWIISLHQVTISIIFLMDYPLGLSDLLSFGIVATFLVYIRCVILRCLFTLILAIHFMSVFKSRSLDPMPLSSFWWNMNTQ